MFTQNSTDSIESPFKSPLILIRIVLQRGFIWSFKGGFKCASNELQVGDAPFPWRREGDSVGWDRIVQLDFKCKLLSTFHLYAVSPMREVR